MAITRILISGDILRPAGDCAASESVPRIKWLEDVLAPALAEVTDLPVHRLACEGPLHIADLYADAGLTPSLDAWAEIYAGALPSRLAERLASLCQDALVISCEMPPSMALALRAAGIAFIDCMVDPLRFLSDIPLSWRSSSPAVIAAMEPFRVAPFEIRRRAAQIRAKSRWMDHLDVPVNATLLLDQLPGDSAVIDPRRRRRVSWFDYQNELRALATEGPIVWRPHPYRQNADEMEALLGPTTRIDVNVYRLLSHDNLARVVAISSGGVTEARAFGKTGRHLLDRYAGIDLQGWGTPLPVVGHWVSPHFWRTALEPLIPVRTDVPVVAPEKDLFRRSINCDWGFANIDGVVVRNELEPQRVTIEARNAELERRAAALESRNAEIEDRSRELEARNAELEQRLAAVDTRRAWIEQHAEQLSGRNAELDRRAIRLEARNVELEHRTNGLDARNAELEHRANGLDARNAELEHRAVGLEARNAELQHRAAQLEARNAHLEEHAEAIAGRNAQLEERAAELEVRNTELEQHASTLEARTADLDRRNADLERHARAVDARNSDLERRTTEIDARNAALELRAGELEARNVDLARHIADLETIHASVDRRRHELEVRVVELESRIQQLEQHLGELIPQHVLEQRCADLERQSSDMLAQLDTATARAAALEGQLRRVSSADRARVRRLLDEFVHEANAARLRVGVLGAGAHTQFLFASTNLERVPDLFLFDNDPRSWGREMNGRSVRPPHDIASLSLDAVIVSSLAFESEMVAQLEALNLPDLRVVRCYPAVN